MSPYIYLLISIILIIITTILLFGDMSSFKKSSNFKTVPTIEEQEVKNKKFLEEYNKIENKNKDTIPYTWNTNNTLESMKLKPCLSNIDGSSGPGRLTCYTAPAWWYPGNKYDPNNFKSVYYGDRYNPVYNYLGNVQDMYWDFKSVKDTINII